MSPWVRHALAGMGWWKWVGVAAVLIALALTPLTAMAQASGAVEPAQKGTLSLCFHYTSCPCCGQTAGNDNNALSPAPLRTGS